MFVQAIVNQNCPANGLKSDIIPGYKNAYKWGLPSYNMQWSDGTRWFSTKDSGLTWEYLPVEGGYSISDYSVFQGSTYDETPQPSSPALTPAHRNENFTPFLANSIRIYAAEDPKLEAGVGAWVGGRFGIEVWDPTGSICSCG